MKKIIVLLFIISLCNCTSQFKIENKKTNKGKEKMEYFDIEKYKDWNSDTEWNSNETVKFLKKGNDRVEIYFYKKGIQVRLKNTQNYYSTVKTYSYKNKLLQGVSYEFYAIDIGIYKEYDEIGKLVREIDYDKPYKFSIKQLIEKVKKECNVDLEKKIQNTWAKRKVDQNLKKPFYEVSLGSKEIPGQQDYILIDGTTGETLFETIYYTKGDIDTMNPFDQYIAKLKKQEEEYNSYYKTYKGKDYTKKEWEIFEEEWHKNHEENKNKGFWDDIFKRPGKK